MLISDTTRRTRFRAPLKFSKQPLPKGAVSTGTVQAKGERINSTGKQHRERQEPSSSSSSDDSDSDVPPLPRG